MRQTPGAAALRRYSLLSRSDGDVTIHRLVQTVARDQMPAQTTQSWLAAAVALVNRAWPFDEYDLTTWAESARLLPHLLTLIDGAVKQNLDTPAVADLNGDAGFYLKYTGNASAASPYYKRALAVAEKNFEPDHENIALRLNEMGQLLQDLGDYTWARPYLERALAIDEKALGPDHPDVAIDLNNLGQLLQAVGDYAGARPYMERALVIFEASLGADHPHTTVVGGNLASLLAEIERLS